MDTCRHFFGAFERFPKADSFGIRSPPIIFELYGLGLRHTVVEAAGKRGSGGGFLHGRPWVERKIHSARKERRKGKKTILPFLSAAKPSDLSTLGVVVVVVGVGGWVWTTFGTYPCAVFQRCVQK